MKLILTLLGLVLIVLAAVYLLMPADALLSFLPGFDASIHRPRMKHGLLSGAVGVVLLAAGWWMGRR